MQYRLLRSTGEYIRSLIMGSLVSFLLVPVAFAQFNDGGQTVLLQHPEQGSQITFMGPRGKTYLWYGGSTEVLEGRYYAGEHHLLQIWRRPL